MLPLKKEHEYRICGKCNEPGTGSSWCRPCNAKRFKENFKNWTNITYITSGGLVWITDNSSDIGAAFLNEEKSIKIFTTIVQYTKEADIYSFGIIMNEFMTEEIPYNNITHDYSLGQQLKELYQILKKFYNERNNKNSEIHSQIVKCEKIRKNKLKINGSNESRFDKPENIQIHPKAIYTSRLLNFNNLPEPTNSSDL
ncbi:hypothetical protein RhiirA1_469828 [Rhizophagus irregularis]|uniref:Protein kinase domain-containing protein n=1 Tax=Rhizophagus irregularis TaxID=588596 RepID=A0A2N0R7A9_9GLOM|nr:hypothetical protein RhiirA1_469828 [Rhizophagus irregularis]